MRSRDKSPHPVMILETNGGPAKKKKRMWFLQEEDPFLSIKERNCVRRFFILNSWQLLIYLGLKVVKNW